MEIIAIVLACALFSTALFGFWIIKGGFNKRFLYTDNLALALGASFFSWVLFKLNVNIWMLLFLFSPGIVLILFGMIFLYRFFRNPKRKITALADEFVSPADGRIIYIKEMEANQPPVTVKKQRITHINEITKTTLLKQPCYLIGIAMTLFDVHYNRAPIGGRVVLVQHTDGDAMGLNKPESTIMNERNTLVIERQDGVNIGVVQIAARFVRRCIISVKEGDQVEQGSIIGRICWGSQTDVIIPRNCEIFIREGEQVYAGTTILAKGSH